MRLDPTLGGGPPVGLLSYLSPCTLPMVPFYQCCMAGTSMSERKSDQTITAGAQRRLVVASRDGACVDLRARHDGALRSGRGLRAAVTRPDEPQPEVRRAHEEGHGRDADPPCGSGCDRIGQRHRRHDRRKRPGVGAATAQEATTCPFDGSFEDATFAVESAIVGKGLVTDYGNLPERPMQ